MLKQNKINYEHISKNKIGGLDNVLREKGLSEAFIRTIEDLKRFEHLSQVPKGRKPRGFYLGLGGISNAILQVLEFKKTKGVLPQSADLSLRAPLYSGYWREYGIEKWDDILLLSNIMEYFPLKRSKELQPSRKKNKGEMIANLKSFLSKFTEHAEGKVLDLSLLHECYLSHNEQVDKDTLFDKRTFPRRINGLGYKLEQLNVGNRTWIMDLRLSREGYYKFRNIVDPSGREEIFYNTESECNEIESKELCKVMSCEPLQKYLKDLIKEHDLGDYQKDILNTAILIEKKLNKKNLFRHIGVKACAVLYLVTPLKQEESAKITGVSFVAMRSLLRELKIRSLKTMRVYDLRALCKEHGIYDELSSDFNQDFSKNCLIKYELVEKIRACLKKKGYE